MKNLKTLLTVTSLAFLSALTFAQDESNTIILDKNGVNNLRIELVEAEEREFNTIVFAIGRIEEIPSNRTVVSSRIAGRVTKINVFEGDSVTEGQVLATVESRLSGDPPPTIELKASQSGLVISSHVRLGQPVEPALELLDISDRSTMWAVAKIPEQEAAQVRVGSTAHIRIPALGSEEIDAKLVRFGVDADRQAGAIEGIFELDNSEGRLLPGMRAEFAVVLSHRSNVLSVPRDSIQGDPANRVVFVKDFELPNAFVRSPVILGEQNDDYVEVVSGLFPGDLVVTSGSYSLGFVIEGSGISLKEALDAAHGHEHNEDGSEITPDQKAAANKTEENRSDEANAKTSKALFIYSAVMTLLFVIVAQLLWRKMKRIED
ncbi:MAG: efflux RND transporter periplasmic adaptor subunit [Verrucomicrobia bacterium]|nr:efflux RND transporter periplasmic adaptor subunit [Verrucomicrobiota bacterium]MDA1068326.1 efflux RND transporter periplasmic adaptor subunit [Verrucomicrobiota bacterium]